MLIHFEMYGPHTLASILIRPVRRQLTIRIHCSAYKYARMAHLLTSWAPYAACVYAICAAYEAARASCKRMEFSFQTRGAYSSGQSPEKRPRPLPDTEFDLVSTHISRHPSLSGWPLRLKSKNVEQEKELSDTSFPRKRPVSLHEPRLKSLSS